MITVQSYVLWGHVKRLSPKSTLGLTLLGQQGFEKIGFFPISFFNFKRQYLHNRSEPGAHFALVR